MDFAVVFETTDSTMTWADDLTYTGGSASFLTQVAITETAVTDESTGGSALYKFLASYEVDSPLTNSDSLAADLSFTFNGAAVTNYQYLYQFTIGAVDPNNANIAVNTLSVGDEPVVVVEESSSKGFPWLWVILGIIIVGAILYFFVL